MKLQYNRDQINHRTGQFSVQTVEAVQYLKHGYKYLHMFIYHDLSINVCLYTIQKA